MSGVIKLNPAIFKDKRDAAAVAWNEALRLFMEDEAFTPKFDVTPAQLEFFKGTAYADDPGALAKTVVARIATRDTSVPDPTPGQIAETRRLLEAVLKKHKGTPDAAVVEKMLAEIPR